MPIFKQNCSKIVKALLSFVIVVGFFAPFASAEAATVKKTDFKGQVTTKIVPVTLKTGESTSYTVTVKNTGKATWLNTGSRFVSIYTYFPKYRTSVFADKSWYKKDEPVKMKEKSVKPGAKATFTFKLTAPDKAGTYEEGFYVAAEGFTWIDGTQIKIPVTVTSAVAQIPNTPPKADQPRADNNQTPKPPVVVTPPVATNPSSTTPTPSSGPLAAELLIKSFQDRIKLAGGESAKISIGLKNTGSVTWQTRILRLRSLSMASSSSQLVSFADGSWPNSEEASRVREPISPGNIAYFEFNIMAPEKRGDYTLPLKLVIDEKDVPGMTIDIPVTVTEDAPQLPSVDIPVTSGLVEPNIRVGLWKVPGGVTLLNSSDFSVIGTGGSTLTTVTAGTVITVGFNRETKTVVVSTPSGQFTAAPPVRFVPKDPGGLFQVPNFDGWTATAYINQFRGTMEMNYYAPNDNVWLIEELPLEQYLRGLAETSNDSNHEFQKTLIIAARNYAYYVHAIGGKYDLFDVQTGASDQVYRAYGSETIRPNLVRAVEETRGQVVLYNNDVVVTPYFSRSDGRTRAWSEVWNGSRPWCVSVPTPHDVGKTLWGHGVGMSATDALGWANEGKTYDWILKYFYTGIELKKIY